MKYILIFLIASYQKIISPFLHAVFGPGRFCRFEETCSQYCTRVISEHGVLKGLYLSFYRISRCQPFLPLKPKYESI